MEKFVLWRDFFGEFRATTEENYHARIQDARRVLKFPGFSSAAECLEYLKKNGRGPVNVTIIEE